MHSAERHDLFQDKDAAAHRGAGDDSGLILNIKIALCHHRLSSSVPVTPLRSHQGQRREVQVGAWEKGLPSMQETCFLSDMFVLSPSKEPRLKNDQL